jgi:hypothetical protein
MFHYLSIFLSGTLLEIVPQYVVDNPPFKMGRYLRMTKSSSITPPKGLYAT